MFHGRSILVQEYKRSCVWGKKKTALNLRSIYSPFYSSNEKKLIAYGGSHDYFYKKYKSKI